MRHLAVQIRDIDRVVIDHADVTHAAGSEVQGGRAAEAACADDQDAQHRQSLLRASTEAGNDHLAAVALDTLVAEVAHLFVAADCCRQHIGAKRLWPATCLGHGTQALCFCLKLRNAELQRGHRGAGLRVRSTACV
jgi:hypothetical protein